MSNSIKILVLLMAGLTLIFSMCPEGDFNYDRSDNQCGPDQWGVNFPTCRGTRNSPINFQRKRAISRKGEAFIFKGWNRPAKWKVSDDVYSVKFSLGEDRMTTAGGNLFDTYIMSQFHFHWGNTNRRGSEHTVNGRSYPLEFHFVHYRSDFATIGEAVASDESDALAVLGFFFKIQKRDNPALRKIINGVEEVRNNNRQDISNFPLAAMIRLVGRATKKKYYRYMGGLTTPACNEIVRWTVFSKPIGISRRQMRRIRTQDFPAGETFGTEFYRDTVPIGDRTVTLFKPSKR